LPQPALDPTKSQLCTAARSNYTQTERDAERVKSTIRTRQKSRCIHAPGSNNLCIRPLRLRDCVLHIHQKSAPPARKRGRGRLFFRPDQYTPPALSDTAAFFCSATSCCPFSAAGSGCAPHAELILGPTLFRSAQLFSARDAASWKLRCGPVRPSVALCWCVTPQKRCDFNIICILRLSLFYFYFSPRCK
jgi:hypothetical protein